MLVLLGKQNSSSPAYLRQIPRTESCKCDCKFRSSIYSAGELHAQQVHLKLTSTWSQTLCFWQTSANAVRGSKAPMRVDPLVALTMRGTAPYRGCETYYHHKQKPWRHYSVRLLTLITMLYVYMSHLLVLLPLVFSAPDRQAAFCLVRLSWHWPHYPNPDPETWHLS